MVNRLTIRRLQRAIGAASGGTPLPTLATVATTGRYSDLVDEPQLVSGQVIVTVSQGYWVSQVVSAEGVTPSSVLIVSLAPALDSDENSPDMLSIDSLSATPMTNQILIEMSFKEITSGPIKLNWSINNV